MEKKNTIKIFQKLQSGAFICSDSSDREMVNSTRLSRQSLMPTRSFLAIVVTSWRVVSAFTISQRKKATWMSSENWNSS